MLFPLEVAGDTPLKKATFIPQWCPQAQFAGYFVAYEKGFYRKHGIDLVLLPGGANNSPVIMLREKSADFVTLWLSTAVREREKGLEIVNLAQVLQRSALMLVAKKASGIVKPEDLNGKKVGLWREDFRIPPSAFFRKYNLKVRVVPQSFSVNLFLRNGVDVASAMWYNEYHTILNAGLNPEDLTTFFFHDHGLNFPEDGIYARAETWNKDPRLCSAFVKASLEGWLYAFAHEEEALDIVLAAMRQARLPANRMHQKWMLERMKDLILPKGMDPGLVGRLQQPDYDRVTRTLQEGGLIRSVVPFDAFYVGAR